MKNKLQEKPYSTTFGVDPNKFLLTPPRIALSGYSSPQANRRNRKIELYFFLKLDEVFFANISQGKNGKVLVRILRSSSKIVEWIKKRRAKKRKNLLQCPV